MQNLWQRGISWAVGCWDHVNDRDRERKESSTLSKVWGKILRDHQSLSVPASGRLRNRGPFTSMRSMRGGFILRNRGPSLEVHHGQCLTSMTMHDEEMRTGRFFLRCIFSEGTWLGVSMCSMYCMRGGLFRRHGIYLFQGPPTTENKPQRIERIKRIGYNNLPVYNNMRSMRSIRSIRCGFIFRNRYIISNI